MDEKYLNILEIDSIEDIDEINWYHILTYKKLDEDFLSYFSDYFNHWEWTTISQVQTISENFMNKFKNKIDWNSISKFQKLSEEFITDFKDRVAWANIEKYQNLSESFIKRFEDKLFFRNICKYQKLSEKFLSNFMDKMCFEDIFKYHPLSIDFIMKYHDKFGFHYISFYHKLPEEIFKPLEFIQNINWLYWDRERKMEAIKACRLYEIDGDYIYAYKSTRYNGYSVFSFHYQYEINKEYSSHCDCNIDENNSFGLSAWTKEGALKYHSYGELYKVKIHIDDVGALTRDDHKLRCFKFVVLERII